MRTFGFAGWSGSGKTTLIERLIPQLTVRGVRVSLVKHAHHEFDVDQPGKDSWRHRNAGCAEVLVTSSVRYALMHELRGAPEPALRELVHRLSPTDLVIVEGYKRERIPKLEIYRAEIGKPLLHLEDDWIVAIASDGPLPQASVPVVDLNDAAKIADILLAEAIPVERLDLPVPVR